MAYKVFANGNPLPASDLNTYLMNQAVISFANSTARSTAIPTPVEGMLTYLEDTNAYEGWTGSAWVNINDNSGAIPLSTVTTAGDLIVANGNASVTRLGIGANGSIPRVASGALGYLPVGTNGQVLTVSGGAPTWSSPAGGTTDWTLLNNGTNFPTGANTSTLSLTQNYDKYVLIIRGASATTAGFTLNFLILDDQSNVLTADVVAFGSQGGGGSFAFFNGGANLSVTNITMGSMASATASITGAIELSGASKAGKMYADYAFAPSSDGSGNWANFGRAYFNVPTGRKFGSIRIQTDLGNIDAGSLNSYGA